MRRDRWAAPLAGAGLWSLLWWSPWQAALAHWPALRTTIALLVVLAPGAALHRLLSGRGGAAEMVGVGLLLSTATAALLGLAGSALHATFATAAAAFWAIGALALAAALRTTPDGSTPRQRAPWLAALPAALAVALAARYALAPQTDGDNYTYLALITEMAHGERLGFAEFVHGSGQELASRFWLCFWPFTLALVARAAALDALPLTALYLGPLLAVCSLAAVAALARGLELSARQAALAVVAQVVWLLWLCGSDQPGWVFFARLREDKVAAAFVLAPAFWLLASRHLGAASWRSGVLLGLGAIGLLLTHATIFAGAALTAVIHAGLWALRTRRLRVALGVALVVGALALIPFSFRFAGDGFARQLQFRIDGASPGEELRELHRKRLARAADGSFRVQPSLTPALPYGVFFAAVALCVWRRREQPASAFLAAAAVVTGSVMLPQTAALLAAAITPFHLWRVLWLTPFGLALAAALPSRSSRRIGWQAAAAAAQVLVLIAAWQHLRAHARLSSIPLAADWRTMVDLRRRQPMPRCAVSFTDLARAGAVLDRVDGDRRVAGDRYINHLLAGVSHRAPLLFFRNPLHMRQLGIAPGAVDEAYRQWQAAVDPAGAAAQRLAALDAGRVQFLVVCGDADWAAELTVAAPQRVRAVLRAPTLTVYEIGSHVAPG